MSMCCSREDRDKIARRLNRIEGQIRGINRMVAGDAGCAEVLAQISSATAALRGVWKQIVRGHLNGHIRDAIVDGRKSSELIDELVEQIDRLR